MQNDPDAAAIDDCANNGRFPSLGELARLLPKGSKFGKPYLVPPERLDEWKRGVLAVPAESGDIPSPQTTTT